MARLMLQQGAHEPDWAPLEDTLLGDFMFMGYAQGIRMYKHAQTRRYLNLDPQGRAYRYVAEKDLYEPMPLPAALAHAFS